MSQIPSTTPDLPSAGQIQELIDLLTRVLEQARGTDMQDAIKAFVATLTEVLAQLKRLSEELGDLLPATAVLTRMEERQQKMDRRVSRMETMLTRIHDEMMAPLEDPD